MRGNSPVRFLGEGTAVMSFSYPTSSTGVSATVPAVTLSSLGVAMADAGLSAICSQAASSLLQTGSLKEMSQDLTSSQFAKSLTITLASAGLMNKLSGTLNLPTQPKGWEHLKVNATRSLVTTPLHVFIGGEKPEEVLLDGVKSCVAHTVGGITSNSLGDLYGKGNLPYLLHKGGHFGTGFLLSLGLSEGEIEEAIGSGIAALGAEIGAESLPSSLSREARGNIAKVGGSLAGLLAGAKKGTGIFTACNAIDHNFLTQEDEFLQKKKQEEEELDQILASLSFNLAGTSFTSRIIYHL